MDKEGGAGRQDPTDDFFGSKLFNLIKTNVEGCLEEKEKKEEKIGGGGREEGEEEEILAGGRTDGQAGQPKVVHEVLADLKTLKLLLRHSYMLV